jgi:catechol 2,3-dioxygenase-like lactoylglutathione lyase family enzyme
VEPRVTLVTLGVSDLKRAVAFYRDGLGCPKSDVGGDEVAFFKTGGVVIALFPRESFAAAAGVDVHLSCHTNYEVPSRACRHGTQLNQYGHLGTYTAAGVRPRCVCNLAIRPVEGVRWSDLPISAPLNYEPE